MRYMGYGAETTLGAALAGRRPVMIAPIACFIMLCAIAPMVVVFALWAAIEIYAWATGKK